MANTKNKWIYALSSMSYLACSKPCFHVVLYSCMRFAREEVGQVVQLQEVWRLGRLSQVGLGRKKIEDEVRK